MIQYKRRAVRVSLPLYRGRGLKSPEMLQEICQLRLPLYRGRGLKYNDKICDWWLKFGLPLYRGRGLKYLEMLKHLFGNLSPSV